MSLSNEKRAQIVDLSAKGCGIAEIARELNIAKNTVRRWVRRHGKEGIIEDKRRYNRGPRKYMYTSPITLKQQDTQNNIEMETGKSRLGVNLDSSSLKGELSKPGLHAYNVKTEIYPAYSPLYQFNLETDEPETNINSYRTIKIEVEIEKQAPEPDEKSKFNDLTEKSPRKSQDTHFSKKRLSKSQHTEKSRKKFHKSEDKVSTKKNSLSKSKPVCEEGLCSCCLETAPGLRLWREGGEGAALEHFAGIKFPSATRCALLICALCRAHLRTALRFRRQARDAYRALFAGLRAVLENEQPVNSLTTAEEEYDETPQNDPLVGTGPVNLPDPLSDIVNSSVEGIEDTLDEKPDVTNFEVYPDIPNDLSIENDSHLQSFLLSTGQTRSRTQSLNTQKRSHLSPSCLPEPTNTQTQVTAEPRPVVCGGHKLLCSDTEYGNALVSDNGPSSYRGELESSENVFNNQPTNPTRKRSKLE